MVSVTRRSIGSSEFTWADLLHSKLSDIQVYGLYFPTRFELDVDVAAKAAIQVFGKQTGPGTSINFWDPTDPEFSRALEFFDLKEPGAFVLARGFKLKGKNYLSKKDLYAIAITEHSILSNRERLAAAINCTHEILMRGDAKEISSHVRGRKLESVLTTIGKVSAAVRDQLLAFKPKIVLPTGVSIQVG